jgi:hypothetical protein
MKSIYLLCGLAFITFTLNSCNKNDNKNTCDQQVIISTDEYNNAPADQMTITDIKINGNCLKISFTAGGCDGTTWDIKLIDSDEIFYTEPPQRDLRLSLKNEEECDALISKEVTFDISALQVDGGKVSLNIINADEQILYEY